MEYASTGIRVNCIAPAQTDTKMMREATPDWNKTKANLETNWIPLGRVGTPEEIADCCAFLASDLASFVTGSSLIVDGGYLSK